MGTGVHVLTKLNDKVWVDARMVIAVYTGTDGVVIKFADGTTLTVDGDKDKTAEYVDLIAKAG